MVCWKVILLRIGVPRARRVLDFGCGTGWVLAEAQKEGVPFCVGVDYAPPAGPRPFPMVAGDGQRLPFAGGAFDVVIGHVSAPYMNTGGALREIYRVLAPGGSVLLTFHSFAYLRRRLAKRVRERNWKDILFLAYLAVNGLLNHCALPQARLWWNRRIFETVNTARGVHRSARAAGFCLISTEHAGGRIFFAFTARKPGPDGVLPAPAWAAHSELTRSLG